MVRVMVIVMVKCRFTVNSHGYWLWPGSIMIACYGPVYAYVYWLWSGLCLLVIVMVMVTGYGLCYG